MRPLDIFYALLVCFIWGGNFIAARYGLNHVPPIFLTMLRFLLVTLLLVPFVKRPTREQMKSMALLSAFNTLHFSLPYVGMSLGLSIASTAITTQLGVPFSCLMGALFLHDRLGPWRTLGMIVAFIGMLIVFGAPEISNYMNGFFCALGAAFFWAITNILVKSVKTDGMLQMLAWMSLLSTPQLLVFSLVVEPGAWRTLADIPQSAVLGLIYSSLMSTVVAYGLWSWLLRKYPVSKVTPYSLLTPILGAAFAHIFFGETMSHDIVLGGAITIAGVAVIVMRRPRLKEMNEPI